MASNVTDLSTYPSRNSGHSDSHTVGIEFQDFVCIELSKVGIIIQNINSKKYQYAEGENIQGFEIKYDGPHTETGRLSIEIAEKRKGENQTWVRSGIYRNDNTWLYVQGNYKMFFVFPVKFLRALYETKKYPVYEHPKENPTIQKFYLSHEEAKKYSARYFSF